MEIPKIEFLYILCFSWYFLAGLFKFSKIFVSENVPILRHYNVSQNLQLVVK